MKSKVIAAFDAASQGFSPDRVVVDPSLNAAFLGECVRLGLAAASTTLNRALLNLRKQGQLSGRKSRRTSFPNEDDYRFAAEMAVRFLERRDGVSLDDIICDPALTAEFDALAARICPGHTPLQYRWAALNLRKSRKLEPELLAKVARPTNVLAFLVEQTDPTAIPSEQGLYLFYSTAKALYVGESENLRSRITKHLDHSDNKGLAQWMWEHGSESLHLEIQILDRATPTRVRRALELELIRSRNPLFNVRR